MNKILKANKNLKKLKCKKYYKKIKNMILY